jgi:hypothetical protein
MGSPAHSRTLAAGVGRLEAVSESRTPLALPSPNGQLEKEPRSMGLGLGY